MKLIFGIVFLLIFSSSLKAQNQVGKPNLSDVTLDATLIGKDSVVIHYNDIYNIVKSSCTQIIRYGHYNFKTGNFFGKFKDVSATDPNIVIADGTFSNEGLKNGKFIFNFFTNAPGAKGEFIDDKYNGDWVFYYPNKNLKLKCSFKLDKYAGKCEMYYEDGSPRLFFDVQDGICKVLDEWTEDGTQIVKNGNGYFKSVSGANWHGKLINGSPDSTWTCKIVNTMGGVLITEEFKDGKFFAGHVTGPQVKRDYEDKSSIVFTPFAPQLVIKDSQHLSVEPFCDTIRPTGTFQINVILFNKKGLYKSTEIGSSTAVTFGFR